MRTRTIMLSGVLIAPTLLGTALIAWLVVGESSGWTPFAEDDPPRNSAEAAAVGDAASVLRFIRLGDGPLDVQPVRAHLLPVPYVTTLQAAVWSRRLDLIQILDAEGAIASADTRSELACLALDLGAPDIALYLTESLRHCQPGAELIAGESLVPGTFIRSENGQFRLTYQTDGNLVLYDDSSQTAVWATNTLGEPNVAVLQPDGNFVVYDGAGGVSWNAGVTGVTNAHLSVENNGNLVIYDSRGSPVWNRSQSTVPTGR